MSLENRYAQVLHDFEASYGDELSCKTGDLIQILYTVDKDWVYAKSFVNNQSGIVPLTYLNFVEIPDYLLSNENTNPNKRPALFLATESFGHYQNDDLDFEQGELIVGQKNIDDNWMYGYYLNKPSKRGIFPLTYVKTLYIFNEDKEIKTTVKKEEPVKENNLLKQDEIFIPKQAKALESFQYLKDSLNSDNRNYLCLEKGEYVLVTGKLDQNWLVGEKLSGEKGLISSSFIQIIEDKNPSGLLNRTQRRFTLTNDLNTSNNNLNSMENSLNFSTNPFLDSVNEFESFSTFNNNNNNTINNTNELSFCIVNFDFIPENETELGCLKGEYLKVLEKISTEWIKCMNFYEKSGIVPLNFVTVLDQNESLRLNESFCLNISKNKQLAKMKSNESYFLRNLVANEIKAMSPPVKSNLNNNSNHLNNQTSPSSNTLSTYNQYSLVQNLEKSSSLNHLNAIRMNNMKSKSLTTDQLSDMFNSESLISVNSGVYKPLIPPKPKHLSTSMSTSSNQIPYLSPRPKMENKELSNRIKDIEDVIEKQVNTDRNSSNLNGSSDPFNSIMIDSIISDNTETSLPKMDNGMTSSQITFSNSYINEQEPFDLIKLNDNTKVVNRSGDFDHITDKKKLDRVMTINELIQTEKNYFNELQTCYDLFMPTNNDNQTNNQLVPPAEFNKYLLFDRLKPIIDFSKKLIELFDIEISNNNNNLDEIKIGSCLNKSIDEMKIIYAQYARNHNDIATTVKKYETQPELNEYITSQLNTVKDKFLVAALPTILIKPVQRIFKYPLFLSRIIQNTDHSHPDYINLKTASNQFTIMLEFINEYKRRQDLVSKYLSKPSLAEQTDISIIDLMKKINLKSIRKKSSRFSLQLYNILGIHNPQISDENFNQLEYNYRLIEKITRNYFNDLNSFLSTFRDLLDNEKNIFTDLLFIFDDDFKTFSKFESSSNQRRSIEFQEYANKLVRSVLNPVKSVLNLFNGPNKLISKRNDKLLDYENALNDADLKITSLKELQNNLEKTKKDYEAMNLQLIEELPILTENVSKILLQSAEIFVIITSRFIKQIKTAIKTDIQATNIDLTCANDVQRSTLSLKLNNLVSVFNRQSISLTNDLMSQSTQSIISTQNEEQRQKLLNNYPIDKLYVVTQKYIANEKLCQLSQSINDIVALKIPYDPAGQKHIWFVDNGDIDGFIPHSALTPYQQMYNNSNLINFEDEATNQSRNSVQVKSNPFAQELTTINEEKYCIAMYNYKATTSNTINLMVDEIYKVIEMADKKGDKEWWLLEYHGKVGYAPKSFVKLLD